MSISLLVNDVYFDIKNIDLTMTQMKYTNTTEYISIILYLQNNCIEFSTFKGNFEGAREIKIKIRIKC